MATATSITLRPQPQSLLQAQRPKMPEQPTRIEHRLGEFSGRSYDKGRSISVQALWFATQNLLFGAWWFPARLRPAVLRAFGAQIGHGVFIRHRVRVLWPWKLQIGDHSWVGEGVWLLNLEPIVIGKNVCISQEAFLCTGSHDFLSPTFEYDNGQITIGDDTWLATQALVLRGSDVGRGVLAGGRAVIQGTVPDGARVFAAPSHY